LSPPASFTELCLFAFCLSPPASLTEFLSFRIAAEKEKVALEHRNAMEAQRSNFTELKG
jgi:hypothetical protein